MGLGAKSTRMQRKIALDNEIARKYKAPLAPSKIICITVPKCGTHLLVKCISLFGIPEFSAKYDKTYQSKKMSAWKIKKYKKIIKKYPPHHFKGEMHTPTMGPLPQGVHQHMLDRASNLLNYHWAYTVEADQLFNENGIANFFIIRDPRAMLVSMAYMVKDGRLGEHADVEAIIWDLIDGRQKSFVPWGVTIHNAYPLIWEMGVTQFYKLFLPWMNADKFLTIRFEDLIGSKGGGGGTLQLQTINAIAQHIGISLPPEKIVAVRDELFGRSITFREGKIDGWKKHFTSEMKAAYKAVPGANQLLIDLGYEKDANW